MFRSTGRWRGSAAALSLLWVGCIVDEDSPCGENQVPLEGLVAGCVCAPNAVVNEDSSGCTPCGPNQVVSGGACVCDVGFAPVGPQGECVVSALEAPCSETVPCGSAYPFCAPGGYCTKAGCATSAECEGTGYWCDTSGEQPFCRRPPVGLGKTCTTDADCAGLEATRCAQGSCQVTGCATGPACFSNYACCDFRQLAPMIGDICVPPEQITDGACPAGVPLVVRP